MALCPGFTHTDFHASERLTAMKGNMPKFAWYDADVVIRDGLAAIEKGKDVCISGRLYRLFVPVFRQRWTQGLLEAARCRDIKRSRKLRIIDNCQLHAVTRITVR